MSGCIGELTAITQTAISAANLYFHSQYKPVEIISPVCSDRIQPISPSIDYEVRLTEEEKNQIVNQAVALEELCPKKNE